MNVELTGRAEAIVRKAIERGEYASAEEMIGEALAYKDIEIFDFVLTPEADARIEEGIAQAGRGEGRGWREVMDELRAKHGLD